MSDSIVYRKIQSSDLIPLKTLHQEFFPVQYSDSFYIDACQEKGIRNGFLFTLIATIHDEIVGFLLGQFIPHNECEDNAIVESNNRITHLFYILTLGVTKEYRRSRIATTLLERSISYARRNKGCGVVYLHVLTTNQSAIKFYESNHFTLSKELYGKYIHLPYINYNNQVLLNNYEYCHQIQIFIVFSEGFIMRTCMHYI